MRIIRTIIFSACIASSCNAAYAQEGNTAYGFLDVPLSAHITALGGNNVSAIEDDATFIYTNPALMSNVSDKTLTFDYSSYISGSGKLGAAFVKTLGERGTWGVAVQGLTYGDLIETNTQMEELGTFSASDIALQVSYSYMLNDKWSGGISLKTLLANYGHYSSAAICADLGLNYYDEAHGWSLGLVGQNLGGQVDYLYEKAEKMPINLVLGISKDFANAPLRLSLTFTDLTRWGSTYNYSKFFNHVVAGIDVFPSRNTWLAVGYNFRNAKDMKSGGKGSMISLGGGINIKKIKVGVAYSRFHAAASTISANVSYTF